MANTVTKLLGFERVIVDKVLSGDTIIIRRGFFNYEKVRLSGINAPKKGPFLLSIPEEKAVDSYLYLEKLLLPGTPIYIECVGKNRDIYGRLLRYVWLDIPDGKTAEEMKDKMINAILLKKGLAEIYMPDKNYKDILLDIQNRAKKEKLGIWKYRNVDISDEIIEKYEKEYEEKKETTENKDIEDIYLKQINKAVQKNN